MLMVMTSPDAVLRQGKPDSKIASVLKAIAPGNPVGLISNHAQPEWFDDTFGGSKVQFLQSKGRQSGEIVSLNTANFKLKPYDALVLAAKDEDVQMGKNGGAVLLAAGWSAEKQVASLGIRVESANELKEMLDLMGSWAGQWWFSGDAVWYGVRALADLSAYGKDFTQQALSAKLTETVKNGGARLNALLAITSRSLLMGGKGEQKDLVWGVYPSSSSTNDDTETLSDFTHRLRTTVSRVRYAAKGEPLFIRHKPSSKRSKGGGGDRTDPSEQIQTLHLNSFYKDKNRLVGKHVIVVDDATTYGVSFGVAAAFLRKAGAASVQGVALGKFGNQLRYYEIELNADPFKPIAAGAFKVIKSEGLPGMTSSSSQQTLQKLIP